MTGSDKDISTANLLDGERLNVEERFRIISELTSDFAYAERIEPDGGPVTEWVSDAVARVTGYTAQEIGLRGWQSIIHPDDLPVLGQSIKNVLAGQPDVSETRIVTKGGEVRWLRNYVRPGWDEARARVVRIYGASQDITELKQAEGATALLASIVESSDDAILSKNLDGVILSWNKGAERLYGYSAGEIVGQPVSIIVPPDKADEFPSIMERLRRGEKIDHYETERIRKDGRRLYVSLTASPIRDASGNIIGASAIARNITERKQAEEALRQSEERFGKAFHSSPLALTITSLRTGRLLEVNETFTRLSGYAREEAVGCTTLELGLWSRATDREAELAMISKHGQVRNIEYRFRMRDGKELVGLLSAEQIEIGGELCALTVIEDITEKKRAEAEREHLLASEQEARRQSEAANRMKDEFLATVSHELRTPLNAILGWVTMLQRTKPDEENATRALETIERNARAQAQLIEDLLDVSRIITGKLRLDVRPIELTSVIKAAIDSILPAADAKGIQLQTVVDPAADSISGDSNRLQQVVWNLLSNAVKFTPKGGQVQIRLDRSDSKAQITVSDTGEGISPDFLPYVFDRFRQADGTITRKHDGLGLGLAIVRHLVEMHGGTIQAHSVGVGQGATFTIRLPLVAVRITRTLPANRSEAASLSENNRVSIDSSILAGLRILVVDDEPDAREMLKGVLEEYGADVLTAPSARDGLDALLGWKPDMLVSDIGMPEEDGYSLIRKVRALEPEQGGNIPAIVLTGYVRVEERIRALKAGYQMFVPKPVEMYELILMIASLVGRTDRPTGA